MSPKRVSMLLKSKALTADLMILLSALLWGGEYVVVKDMVEYLPPNWINAFRFITAALIMIPIFHRTLRTIRKAEIWAGLILGAFLYGGFNLQTVGIQYTTAAKSGFLTSTYVVMVPFVIWALRRKFPGVWVFISAGICTVGIALLSLDGGFRLNNGDLLTLAAALCFTGSIIGFEHYSKIYEPLNLTLMEMTVGGLLSLITALVREPVPTGLVLGPVEIFQLLYLVLLGSLACHLLSNIALKWADASRASILWSMESVFALIFGIIFLHEPLSLRMAAGFVLILSSVLLTERRPVSRHS